MTTTSAFVQKWDASRGTERAVSQEHFIDLCRLLNEPTPNQADPSGDFYAFEKGAIKPDGDGYADVWLKDHFAWEYKGKRQDLAAAYKQVSDYREALGNPPLLVVCDIDRFEVHTNWTNTEKWIYAFRNPDLLSDDPVQVSTVSGPAKDARQMNPLQVLKALWENPDALKPQKTTDQITKEAAKLFGKISDELRKWKVDDMRIARFVTRVLFCMFATDVGLLPRETFSDIIKVHKSSGDNKGFRKYLADLFTVMNSGGEFMMRPIPYFNGRLFEDSDVPEEITGQEIHILAELDNLNWADVEPSIFGTLFERVLDPNKRKQGTYYTSRADIELIVEPVLMAPLQREWAALQADIDAHLAASEIRKTTEEAQRQRAQSLLAKFHKHISTIRILDPACGSGNFLYVSLALLKALEKEVMAFAASHRVVGIRAKVHPRQLFGIEMDPYAYQLASTVIWIGYLQWKHRHVMPLDDEEPVLQPLDQIDHKDAILDFSARGSPVEPVWPAADVIVGNPPFIGSKRLRRQLGDEYVDRLFSVWDGRVARESDYCCYWFEKARAAIESGRTKRGGLLATQGIRGGANRKTLQRIKQTGDIFYAQADRKWIQDGVAVRVSMVGFDDGSETHRRLNDVPDDNPVGALDRALPVENIHANLGSGVDVNQGARLKDNLGIAFQGPVVVGPFYIRPPVATKMLNDANPHEEPNSLVVFPLRNADDLMDRPRGWSIIDFGQRSAKDAALFEAPFEYVLKHVKPLRDNNRDAQRRRNWWRHGRAGTDLKAALADRSRQIATPRVSKFRAFCWLSPDTVVTDAVIAFARDDDCFFGVLHSRAHEIWARATGTQLREVTSGFRYTPTTCFETFPFPQPTKDQAEAIAETARELNTLREGWLNPTPMGGLSLTEEELKKRTLTNLYNQRPTWLANAHHALDTAVFAAYGWPENPADLRDTEILRRLLELNLQREPA